LLAALCAPVGAEESGDLAAIRARQLYVEGKVDEAFAAIKPLADQGVPRAEVILGRGSFTESFPLFGLELRDYETLFEEKLDLFTHLVRDPEVTWSGTTRATLTRQKVYPTLAPEGLMVSVGVGGSPESVVRAVHHDLPMMLAIIGGDPRRFLPYVDLYKRAAKQMNRPVRPLGVHSPGHVAETDELALEQLWPHYRKMHDRIGGERGWPPTTKDRFLAEAAQGSLYAGAPETVVCGAAVGRVVVVMAASGKARAARPQGFTQRASPPPPAPARRQTAAPSFASLRADHEIVLYEQEHLGSARLLEEQFGI
jgi:alkanesulfonate monooxygenase SsuD/methylene tetrahydromethanopterin reductase-like flavin-dependent oxidoreductase (luciferase family)